MISPDYDFSAGGTLSGISYADSYKMYRETLTSKANTPAIRRIYSEIDAAIFGKAKPAANDAPIIDDGNYESDLEELNNALSAEAAATTTAEPDNATLEPPSPSLFASPTQSFQAEHHFSVNVTATSHVSRTITAPSRVLNATDSDTAPTDLDDEGLPPPKTTKAKSSKSSKLAPAASATNTNTSPTVVSKKRNKETKVATVVESSARHLRSGKRS